MKLNILRVLRIQPLGFALRDDWPLNTHSLLKTVNILSVAPQKLALGV